MKKTFIFDKLDDELVSLDESTIVHETGIDPVRVKEAIMKEVKGERKTKKATIRRLFSIVAIAAAIAAAATISVQAATGGFHPIFGELFAGEPANGVFPGSDITVKSDTLDVEFLGVTGDDNMMISVFDIKKKDGSDFIETFDTPEDYRFLSVKADISVTENKYKTMMYDLMGGGQSAGSGVHYEFVDEKTIRTYTSYSDSLGYIKGETLTVRDWDTIAYHIDEVLYSDDSETLDGCLQFLKDNEDFIEQKVATLNENQIITFITEDPMQVVVATKTELPLQYRLDVTLNYKTIEKTFPQAKGKKFDDEGTEWTIKKVTAEAFGLVIDAATDNNKKLEDFNVSNSANWSPEEAHDYMNSLSSSELNIEITLKDGTKVYGEASSSDYQGEASGKGKSSWSCAYFKEGEETKMYTLDPNDIISIKCEGIELLE